jgi:hypothetical protein
MKKLEEKISHYSPFKAINIKKLQRCELLCKFFHRLITLYLL